MRTAPPPSNPSQAPLPPVAVVIGRWQIFHNGHLALVRHALAGSPTVLVVIGSAWRSRDADNPFNVDERMAMVSAALTPEERSRVQFAPLRDFHDDARWTTRLRAIVAERAPGREVVVVGYEKDASSYYLRNLAPWRLERVQEKFDNLDATSLRAVYFGATDLDSALAVIQPSVPPGVLAYLQAWGQLPLRAAGIRARKALAAYRDVWTADFSVAADAVVRTELPTGPHVLLVRRKGPIGEGLWAVPGGFVDKAERTFDAALRELREETGLDLWKPQAMEALRGQAVLDDPARSPRGRIISHAYFFDLGRHKVPPEVRASDDAMQARWTPVEELPGMLPVLFEDHGLLLERFLGHFADD